MFSFERYVDSDYQSSLPTGSKRSARLHWYLDALDGCFLVARLNGAGPTAGVRDRLSSANSCRPEQVPESSHSIWAVAQSGRSTPPISGRATAGRSSAAERSAAWAGSAPHFLRCYEFNE
jgi:hypothetical protein